MLSCKVEGFASKVKTGDCKYCPFACDCPCAGIDSNGESALKFKICPRDPRFSQTNGGYWRQKYIKDVLKAQLTNALN